jgi:hypothetical protein
MPLDGSLAETLRQQKARLTAGFSHCGTVRTFSAA